MKDLFHNVLGGKLLAAINITASQVSVGADINGFESLTLDTIIGASLDTLSGSVFIELILEESDTLGSGYTPVTNNDHVLLPSGETVDGNGRFLLIDNGTKDDILKSIGYVGNKRFARINIALTGTHTNGTPVSVASQLGDPHRAAVQ